MKKLSKVVRIVLIVLLILVLLLAGYFFVGMNWHYFFDLRSQAIPYDRMVIDTFTTDSGVRYEIAYMDGRVDYVEFNADRECVASQGITPIDFDRRSLWGYWSYEDFVAAYGEYHVDTGSMVFWPGWFTEDGYLITLWRGGEKWFPLCIGNIGEVWVYDLLATPE